MKPFLYVIKIRLLLSLAYRFEVFSSILTQLIIMLASVFLWTAAYNGVDQVAGVNQNQMLIYAVMIGDRKHDIIGVRDVGIDSIGVMWGCGSNNELETAGSTRTVNTIDELYCLIIGESE